MRKTYRYRADNSSNPVTGVSGTEGAGMSNIKPISDILQYGRSLLEEPHSRTDRWLSAYADNQNDTGSASVSLSDSGRYQSFLAMIQDNRVISEKGYNLQNIAVLVKAFENTRNLRPEFLNDIPDTEDEARLALSGGCVVYIKALLRGKQGLNPFAGLSRLALSLIAWNTSGALTSAERVAAYLEMNQCDQRYETAVFYATEVQVNDMPDMLPAVELGTQITLIAGMCEAEKQDKGMTPEQIHTLQSHFKIWQQDNGSGYQPLHYANLVKSDSADLLVAHTGWNGEFHWKVDSSQRLFDAQKSGHQAAPVTRMVYLGS
ncbi:hypothetical protein DES37_102389 [Mangrovibacter plantisponsor]|uniref:Uncharacterized protein n=2 Tax=Enterobacteriaceae TaxID=543 RepID=A0A317Q5S2_9ENTR|nr:hypothetical protein DES37_102389 [Mangrovibacter plantisponsor]